MVKGVHTLWFMTSDMDRAKTFYKSFLGKEPTYESPFWTSFDCGGLTLGLHGGDFVPAAGGWIPCFECDDLDAAAAELTQLGASLSPERHATPSGLVLDAKDPDGNAIQVIQLGRSAD